MQTRPAKQRYLLATMTNEPFQPVRLYYAVPDPSLVRRKLAALRCMVKAPIERGWQWQYHAEAASLRFPAGGYDDVPKEKRPIVLGRIRFPARGTMTLQCNSLERAIAGARFFAPRLGPEVIAMRCRLVNRCFAADEGQPDTLMATLDQNVTVIDPRVAEAALSRELAGVQSMQDWERAGEPQRSNGSSTAAYLHVCWRRPLSASGTVDDVQTFGRAGRSSRDLRATAAPPERTTRRVRSDGQPAPATRALRQSRSDSPIQGVRAV